MISALCYACSDPLGPASRVQLVCIQRRGHGPAYNIKVHLRANVAGHMQNFKARSRVPLVQMSSSYKSAPIWAGRCACDELAAAERHSMHPSSLQAEPWIFHSSDTPSLRTHSLCNHWRMRGNQPMLPCCNVQWCRQPNWLLPFRGYLEPPDCGSIAVMHVQYTSDMPISGALAISSTTPHSKLPSQPTASTTTSTSGKFTASCRLKHT